MKELKLKALQAFTLCWARHPPVGTEEGWREHILRFPCTNHRVLAMRDLQLSSSAQQQLYRRSKEETGNTKKGRWVLFTSGRTSAGIRLNFRRNLARAPDAAARYIRQRVLCLSAFPVFPSQRELALIKRQTSRKMWQPHLEMGLTKPHSALHNALFGRAHYSGVPPDELIGNNKWYSAKASGWQYPPRILRRQRAHLNQHPHIQPYTHTLLRQIDSAHSENSGSSH